VIFVWFLIGQKSTSDFSQFLIGQKSTCNFSQFLIGQQSKCDFFSIFNWPKIDMAFLLDF
jgi:hypothetical protein